MKIFSLSFIFLLGCTNSQVHLIDNFYSYQTHNELRQLINDPISKDGDENHLSRIVTHYNHIGQEGKLELLFFDDQLVGVGFYPNDSLEYFNQLKTNLNISFEENTIIFTDKVAISKEYDYEMGGVGGVFVSWVDSGLADKYKSKIW